MRPQEKIGVHVPLPSRIAVTSGAEGSIACRVRYVGPIASQSGLVKYTTGEVPRETASYTHAQAIGHIS